MESDTSIRGHEDADAYCSLMSTFEKEFIRVHLYSKPEEPMVQIVPDQLVINNMRIQERVTRVIELRNKSQNLPIIFQYKPSPFVKLDKSYFFLTPNESLQITVHVIPYQFGTIKTDIVFQLVYHNIPKESDDDFKVIGETKVEATFHILSKTRYPTPILNPGLCPNYIRDAGQFCDRLKFKTRIRRAKATTVDNCNQIDKTCSDLVALPNDTQQSLRPRRSLTK